MGDRTSILEFRYLRRGDFVRERAHVAARQAWRRMGWGESAERPAATFWGARVPLDA